MRFRGSTRREPVGRAKVVPQAQEPRPVPPALPRSDARRASASDSLDSQTNDEQEVIMKHAEAMDRTLPLVNCFWCERLHPGAHALSICPECTARYPTMRSLEMCGSYPLDDDSIDNLITRTSAGNYALGYMDGDEFSVFYIGRSDSDLNAAFTNGWARRAAMSGTPPPPGRRGGAPPDTVSGGRPGARSRG